MSEKVGDGHITRREMYEGLLKRTRNPQKVAEYEAELALPPLPKPLQYLWRTFNRLHARRGSSGFGPSPITWTDIDAFMRMTGARLVPWEIEVIEDLDNVFRGEYAKSYRPPQAGQQA